jgi:hypothetical protein
MVSALPAVPNASPLTAPTTTEAEPVRTFGCVIVNDLGIAIVTF